METEWFGNVAKQSAASCSRMHKATVGNLGAGKAGYELNLSGLEASRLRLEAGTSLVTSRCHRRFAVTGAQHLGHAPKPWPCFWSFPCCHGWSQLPIPTPLAIHGHFPQQFLLNVVP